MEQQSVIFHRQQKDTIQNHDHVRGQEYKAAETAADGRRNEAIEAAMVDIVHHDLVVEVIVRIDERIVVVVMQIDVATVVMIDIVVIEIIVHEIDEVHRDVEAEVGMAVAAAATEAVVVPTVIVVKHHENWLIINIIIFYIVFPECKYEQIISEIVPNKYLNIDKIIV